MWSKFSQLDKAVGFNVMKIPLWQCYKVHWPPVSLMISKIKSWTSMSINLLSPIFLPWVTGSAGVYPSYFRVKEGLHTHWASNQFITGPHRETDNHTHSPTDNLELPQCESLDFGRKTVYLHRTHTNKERPRLQQQWQCSVNCIVFLNSL